MEAASSSADDWLRLNRAWWDERAPVHAASEFYDVPGILVGKDSLRTFEPGEVGDVRGKRLLHLMCHIGLDTLSWARRGAVVTGLDFSQPALDAAVSLAGRAGIGSARFVAAEIGEAGRALVGETFDIVHGNGRLTVDPGHRPLGPHGGRPGRAGRLLLHRRLPLVPRQFRYRRW